MQENSSLDHPVLRLRQRLEIVDRQEMNVGRIVPIVGKQLGLGSAASPQVRQAHTPVSEIRERDDGMLAYPQHVVENFQRLSSLLQRLAEDHVVECAIWKL